MSDIFPWQFLNANWISLRESCLVDAFLVAIIFFSWMLAPWILRNFELSLVYGFLQVYCYYPFSALSDPPKLYNDLKWNITRPQGFEAVMRVRCSQVYFFVERVLFMHYSVYSSSRLCRPMFLIIVGYSSSRIFREFLQTHSNGHRSSSGGWILLIFLVSVY